MSLNRLLVMSVAALLSTTTQAFAAQNTPHTTPAEGVWQGLLSTPGKSLAAQRLHPAAFPGETEIRCSIEWGCAFGIVRGFTASSDVLRMLDTQIRGPLRTPGKWFYVDGLLGFQFLEDVDEVAFGNGMIGYKTFGYESSEGEDVKTSGVSFRVTYAHAINSTYTQGIVVDGYDSKASFLGAKQIYLDNDAGTRARYALRKFYSLSQASPQWSLKLPADLEVINWRNSHIDLPGHIRSYLCAQPSFTINSLYLADTVSYREMNFGLKLSAKGSYESAPKNTPQRYAVALNTGVDFFTSDGSLSQEGNTTSQLDAAGTFPKRPAASWFVDVMASYQL